MQKIPYIIKNFFLKLGSVSELGTSVPSGSYFIGMVSEIRLGFFSFNITKLLSVIVSEDPLNLQQCSLGLEGYLGDGLQDVKLKV